MNIISYGQQWLDEQFVLSGDLKDDDYGYELLFIEKILEDVIFDEG